uniref:Uncharacterized protein n=1 Tax=Anguilla anguilla TaxID=7936 RepID=A0A0E9XKB4_ANGAN
MLLKNLRGMSTKKKFFYYSS